MPVVCGYLQGLDMVSMCIEAFYSGRGRLADGSSHITVLFDSIFYPGAFELHAWNKRPHSSHRVGKIYTAGKGYHDFHVYRRLCM
jgi:hypothetical protein